MKQQYKKWVSRILLVAVSYALLLSVCVVVVLAAPYISHADYLNNLSCRAAQEYATGSDLTAIDLHSLGALVYDASGNCVESKLPKFFYHTNNAESAFEKWPLDVLHRVLDGKTVRHVGFVLPKNIGVIYIGEPIYQKGAVTGAFFIIRDLHDLFPTLISICIAYSLFFILAVACLSYSLQKKQKYLQLQNNYVANFSHDLKSPITSIKALAETLQADLVKDDDTRHKYYSTIINETTNLQHTVAGILELSSMQNRQAKMAKQPENLLHTLEPILEKYGMLCYDMMIKLHISDSLQSLPSVHTHAQSITRLVDILLDNAVKFVGTNGEIWVETTLKSNHVMVCIRDNGCGISKEHQKHIFDRFFMGDPSHSGKGSGLGLAIAQEIIAALGEKLWVESALGEGSSFFFTVHLK